MNNFLKIINIRKIYFKDLILYTIFFLIFFLSDRFTKNYIIQYFLQNSDDIIINNYLNIILNWNSGIGFGLFSDFNNLIYNLLSLVILFIILFIFIMFLKSSNLEKIPFFLIIVGALGNFYDRIKYNAVPDFIDFHIGAFHWFTFNFADIYITFGVIIIIILNLKINNEK